MFKFSSLQPLSHVWLFVTPWTAAHQASLSITNSQSLLKLMSIKSVMPSNHLILCHSLLLQPSIFPSIRVFSSESVLHISLPGLEFQLQQQSFQWIFRTDFLYDRLVGSPCSPRDSQESSPTPQFKSIISSVFSFLYNPTFTSVHDYWKTITLTRWTFVGKVMSLLFNLLSRLGHSFSSKEQESFNFMASVTICSNFGDQKNKVFHHFHCFSMYLHEMMKPEAMILVFWMLSFKPTFSFSSFTFTNRLFSSSSLSDIS